MQEISRQWKALASESGAKIELNEAEWTNVVADALSYLYDDDDDEEFELDLETAAQAMAAVSNAGMGAAVVISPFEADSNSVSDSNVQDFANENVSVDGELPFTRENVDKVLNEVRPYLIADGGNVAVERVDEESGNVYLKLEGACGSCPSSTVTMQMGIERVLKENFPSLGQVLQVEDENKETELTIDSVKVEMNRLAPAISAMGASMELVGVDSELGVVYMKFLGSSKVRQGLELALTGLQFVNRVCFDVGDI